MSTTSYERAVELTAQMAKKYREAAKWGNDDADRSLEDLEYEKRTQKAP